MTVYHKSIIVCRSMVFSNWVTISRSSKSQYAPYSAMFCPLHNVMNKDSINITCAINPAIKENTEDSLVKTSTTPNN